MSPTRPRARAVLARLLLSTNHLVTTDALVNAVWEDDPPATARSQIQADISAIRRQLREIGAPDRIETRATGYRLSAAPAEVDLLHFEQLLAAARSAADQVNLGVAVSQARSALALWRGPALGDISGAFADAARVSLDEQRILAVETMADLELRLGNHRELIAELWALFYDHPVREGIARHLAVALHRSGRSAEALDVLRRLREVLVEQHGLDMSPATAELELRILRMDPDLDVAAPAEAPGATVAASTAPSSLPPDIAGFSGRKRHLDQLEALMNDAYPATGPRAAVIAITGSGGIGKTALAVHWAHRAAGRYPDGQLYIDLRGHSSAPTLRPIDALARLLHQLGVPADQVPDDVEYAADLFRDRLARRRVLVVLDNARDSEQVRPLLAGSPGCRTLITSRTELSGLVARDGAWLIRLNVLEPDESLTLLEAALGSRIAGHEDAAAELARLCAHVPLALRIAVARLHLRPRLGIEQLVVDLRTGHRLGGLRLDGDDQTAMAAALDLSHNLLTSTQQRMFRLLSLVPGADYTVSEAAALAGTDRTRADRQLDALARAYMVEEHASGRFRSHDLLRLYSAEQLSVREPQEERAAAQHRLHQHYLSRLAAAASRVYPQVLRLDLPVDAPGDQVFASPAEAIRWIDEERGNLVAVILTTSAGGPYEVAWHLADALRGYYFLRMFTAEWQQVAEAALAAGRAAGDDRAQASAYLSIADRHWRLGDQRAASDAYTRTIDHARRCGWLVGEATALGNLGSVHRTLGNLEDASELLQESLRRNIAAGRLAGEAVNLGNLALLHGELGRYAEARAYYERALVAYREIGSLSAQAACLTNLGETALRMDDVAAAVDALGQATALHEQLGDKASAAETMRCWALAQLALGAPDTAMTQARTALALAVESGDGRVEANCALTLAMVLHRRGDTLTALTTCEDAVRLARRSSHRYVETAAVLELSSIRHKIGNLPGAMAGARQAAALASAAGYRVLEERARILLAQ